VKKKPTKTQVSHGLYMADLKLIGKTEEELDKQMPVVRTSVMIPILNLDLKIVKRLYSRKDN